MIQLFLLITSVWAATGILPEVKTDVLRVTPHVQPAKIEAGDQAELRLDLDLDPGHHAYVQRFKLKVIEPDIFAIDAIKIEPEVEFFDNTTNSKKMGFQGKGTLRAVMEVFEKAPAGPVEATVHLTYQACTSDYCLLPKTIPVKLQFTVLADSTPAPAEPSPVEEIKKGTLSTFLFVFLMGLLTSLTPCIYPMIPITLAVIGSRQGGGKLRGFTLSCVYVLGMALTYALIGLGVAKTGALFGSVMSSPWVIGTISLIFLAMGLSMFGLFELQAPAFIRNRFGRMQTQGGYVGAFAAGLLSGVVASPCVGPVLVAILAYIAQTQNETLGFLLLFTFALGMGVLLIAVGTFGHLLQKLPRSGPWMELVKFVFGSTMTGASLYFAWPILPPVVRTALTGLTCVILASIYGAFQPNAGLDLWGRLRKGLMLTLLVCGIYLIVSSLTPSPSPSTVASVAYKQLKWEAFSEDRVASAARDGRPVIIDFRADWCAACHELEEKTFSQESVQELAKRFVLLTFDATESNAEVTRITQKFGVLGLPTLLFFDARGKVLTHLTLAGFEEAPQFTERMQKALEPSL